MLLKLHILILLTQILLIFNLNAQSSNALSDSLFTDEILIETNRISMSNFDSPNKLQIINLKKIQNSNSSKLSDILQNSDGIFIKDYGFNSGIKTISLNSSQAEHTLILLDGIRLNSRQNAQFDLSLLDLENYERIEISSGSSSALYGSEAIGGIVNIIPAFNNGVKNVSGKFKFSYGSYNYKKVFLSFSHKLNFQLNKFLNYKVSFSAELSDNDYKYFVNDRNINSYKNRINADFNTLNFNFNAIYYVNKNFYLKYFLNYINFKRGVPAAGNSFLNSTARLNDKNFLTYLNLNRNLSDNFKIKTAISFNYSLQKYFDTATFNNIIKIDSYYKINSLSINNLLDYLFLKKVNSVSGLDFNYSIIQSNELINAKHYNFAAFSSFKIKFYLTKKIILNLYPSIRYDYYSHIKQKNVVTAKLGVNFNPFEKFVLKFSAGNSFRTPSFNELYWKDLGNINLLPEKSFALDAGILYKFEQLNHNIIELSYTNINSYDRIVWIPNNNIWNPQNIGKVTSNSFNIGLKSFFDFRKLSAVLNLNYNLSSSIKKNSDFPGDPSFNKQLIYLPQNVIKSSIMLNYLPTSNIIKLVSFNIFFNYYSKRYSDFENIKFEPPYFVLDGNVICEFKLSKLLINLKLAVNNILNKNYSVISSYPMPLRNFKIEVYFKYN